MGMVFREKYMRWKNNENLFMTISRKEQRKIDFHSGSCCCSDRKTSFKVIPSLNHSILNGKYICFGSIHTINITRSRALAGLYFINGCLVSSFDIFFQANHRWIDNNCVPFTPFKFQLIFRTKLIDGSIVMRVNTRLAMTVAIFSCSLVSQMPFVHFAYKTEASSCNYSSFTDSTALFNWSYRHYRVAFANLANMIDHLTIVEINHCAWSSSACMTSKVWAKRRR